MGLFGRGSSVSVTVSPVDATPGTDIHATITTEGSVDKVTTAVADWGYLNFYKYRWAGSTDAANAHSLGYGQNTGSQYGTDKKTEDWVSVQRIDLPVSDGRFDGGTSTFRVPSWAPGSSPDLARWECRVDVDRSGRDAHAAGTFTVRVPAPDSVAESKTERILGDAVTVDIVPDRFSWRIGEPITGHLSFTAGRELPAADIIVYLSRERISHPLTKTPAAHAELDLERIQLDKTRLLGIGTTDVAFAIPTDKSLAPTADTVHSSLDWYVHTRVMYKGFTTGVDRARRRIVLYNA